MSGTTPSANNASVVTDEVSTPCIGICTLGPKDLCIGCLRSSDEIVNWLNISSNERDRIMAELPDRLEVLFA